MTSSHHRPAIQNNRQELTHEEASNLGPEGDNIQLVEGNVEERHEAVEALKENSFHHQRGVPALHRPGNGWNSEASPLLE